MPVSASPASLGSALSPVLRPALGPAAAVRRMAGGLVLLLPLTLLAVAPPAGAQNMMDNMIRKYCLKAVNDEVKASGKPAPSGMADHTCECVVQQMKKRQSIDQAKVTCKNAAAAKYNL
jgi:hypothetical protein